LSAFGSVVSPTSGLAPDRGPQPHAGDGDRWGSCGLHHEPAQPDQVVDGQPKGKHPPDPGEAAMARLAQQADHLEPAEDLLDPLAMPLARLVAGMPRGAAIERTAPVCGVLRDVRGHREPAEGVDEVPGVILLSAPSVARAGSRVAMASACSRSA